MRIKALKMRDAGFLLFVILLLALWYLGRFIDIDTDEISRYLAGFPLALSGLVYIILYIAVSFFIFFAKDIFWLSGAILFGPILSTVFICIAEFFNAMILFSLARLLGREYVAGSLKGRYKELDAKLGNISFFWLFVFRAAPLIPYRFMDLAAGLTKINFRKYLLAVIIGSPVKMFWIQYVLYGVGKNVLKDPSLMVDYFLKNKVFMFMGVFYLALVIMAIFKIRAKE